MIPVRSLRQADVAVFGLARSGVSAVRALKAGGARSLAWDDKQAATRSGRESRRARHAARANGRGIDSKALVLSPGVPLTHPAPHDVVVRARARRRRGDRRHRIVRARDPARSHEARPRAGHRRHRHQRQIDDDGADRPHPQRLRLRGARSAAISASRCSISRRPTAARSMCWRFRPIRSIWRPGSSPTSSVLTNITPDHIDRHGSMENYVAVKARLLEQTDAQRPRRDRRRRSATPPRSTRGSLRAARAETVPVSVGKVLGRGVFAVDGALYDAWGSRASPRHGPVARARIFPARTIGRTRRSPIAATKPFVKDTRSIARRHRQLPGPRPSHRRGRPRRQGALHQRFQGDQCRRRGARAGLLQRYLLDRGRHGPRKAASKASCRISRASAKPI